MSFISWNLFVFIICLKITMLLFLALSFFQPLYRVTARIVSRNDVSYSSSMSSGVVGYVGYLGLYKGTIHYLVEMFTDGAGNGKEM